VYCRWGVLCNRTTKKLRGRGIGKRRKRSKKRKRKRLAVGRGPTTRVASI